MGSIHETTGGSESGPNWTARYGHTDLAAIQPACVIDSTDYGCGTLEIRIRGTPSARRVGLRPLWPDDAKLRDFRDFYSALRASIEKEGVKVPVLLWKTGGKLYVRYGASRLYVLRELGATSVKSIICDFDCEEDDPAAWIPLKTPAGVMEALGRPRYVGVFEVSHERIDLHNVVPE